MPWSPKSRPFLLFLLGSAILVIAIVVVQIILQRSYKAALNPEMINEADGQKIASQRIAKLCLYINDSIAPAGESTATLKDSLAEDVTRLRKKHLELIEENNKIVHSASIDSLLNQCTPYVEQIVTASALFMEWNPNPDSVLQVIATAEARFLPVMALVKNELVARIRKDTAFIQVVDIVSSVVLIGIVLGISLTVYFPTLRQLQSKNKQLSESYDQLVAFEEKLNNERILLRTIIDNIPVNIYTKDLESRKTLANRSEWEYVGAGSEAEVLGKKAEEMFSPEFAELSRRQDEEALSGRGVIARETMIVRDKEQQWLLISKLPLFNERGTVSGLVGISLDISDQKKAMIRLEESLREISELYDYAPCGYHTSRSDGVITRMNKTELDWLGYSARDVIGRMNLTELLTPKSAKEREQNLKKMRETGHMENIEAELVRKDGSIIKVLLNSRSVFGKDGEIIGNKSTAFDITDRKALQDEIRRANDRLIHLNEEKNRFMSMATHDLKNPLNAALGLTNLIKLEEGVPKGALEMIDMIETSARKMKDLIDRLMSYSRIEQGKVDVERKEFDVGEFLTERAKIFKLEAVRKSIRLQFRNGSRKAKVHTDPKILEQVVDNLISNAIKFSERGTQVTLKLLAVGSRFVIEVHDQGPGIPEEEIKRLFKPFSRLSARPTGGETSSGLGLSIVKQQILLLGGDVSVESEVGKGSCFRIVI